MKKIFLLALITFLAVTISFAQIAINADASLPNSSAMLDVKSSNKGMLIPRVALTSTADATTIPSPATSLMVYNTTAAGTGTTAVVPGYYYWGGTAWVRMVSSTTASNIAYKTLIPIASGGTLTLSTVGGGTSGTVAAVGFGNNGATSLSGSDINISFGPNFSFLVPSSGSITDISGTFTVAGFSQDIGNATISITCRVYVTGSSFSNIFMPTAALVAMAPAFTGLVVPGQLRFGTATGLNIPVTGGNRIMVVVSATAANPSGPVPNYSISGYFSGGVNMIIQ